MQAARSPAERFELTHKKGDPTLYRFYRPAVTETFRQSFEECSTNGDVLQGMLRFDRKYFLAGLLNIDDKMCGRHSLESRPSFLHQELVRHVLKVQPEKLLRGSELKPVLRDIGTSILPTTVLHRKDKMGFTTPIGTFVNRSADRVREQITNSRFRDFYDLRRLNFTTDTKYSREVFGLLMLDLWLNRYV